MQNHDNEQWREIATTQSEHELSQGHSFWLWCYRIGIGGSFTALSMFIVERMAGTNAQIWEWTGGQYLNGFIGLVFAFAFSVFVYGFYLTDYSIKQRLFVFSVAVCFPLFAEVSQTMHRGEETTKAASQASPEFKAAQKAMDAMMGSNPAAGNAPALAMASGEKARHEAELAACSRYASAQRREKCERYEQGKIAEAEGKIQGYSAAGNAALSANQSGITNMVTTIGALGNNQEHEHPMVKLFVSFGFSLLVAALIMAVLIIGSIEAALAWIGDHVKNYQKAMRARGLEIGNQKKDVVKVNHGTASPAPMGAALTGLADSAKMTVGEYANKVEQGLKASPEVIANEYARAQHAREQVYSKAADKLENIQSGLNEAKAKSINPDMPEIVESDGFKQSPAQREAVNKLHQEQMKTYREELRGGDPVYSDTPLDKPRHALPKMSVEQTVKQLQANVKASGANSPAAIQAAVFDSFAAMPNPAPLDDAVLERIADRIVINQAHTLKQPVTAVPAQSDSNAQTRPSTVPAQSELPRTGAQAATVPAQSELPELVGTAKQVEADFYPEWLAQVKVGEITSGAREAKQFISKRTKNKDAAIGITAPEMGRIWLSWQDRAANDGVLKPNPKYQPGNRQAKYLLAA